MDFTNLIRVSPTGAVGADSSAPRASHLNLLNPIIRPLRPLRRAFLPVAFSDKLS
jgi:hypothetical protein